jgi:glyoxylase-like metal-dependent hydrolase (beta-lactamase superfamily II)
MQAPPGHLGTTGPGDAAGPAKEHRVRGHVELADGVHQLATQVGINCWVLRDDTGVTLVDTGLARKGLVPKLARLGIAPSDVTRVLLTHGHPDHAGGIAGLIRAGATPSIEVGEGDLATIRGDQGQPVSDVTTRTGRLFNRMPPPGAFGVPVVLPQATALQGGEVLPIAGGLEVIPTPGHTPGHLAFHLVAHDLVIGGDVLFNIFSLRPSPGFLCWRIPANATSVTRLADLAPGTLALAHGRAVTGDVAGRLRQVTADTR